MSALHLVGIALAVASVVLLFQLRSAAWFSPLTPVTPAAFRKPSVFISHNHLDVRLAGALVAVLRAALGLPAAQIRCTSAPASKLSHGSAIDDALRAEIAEAPAFIVLVTPNGAKSDYVPFEVGARWFTRKPLAPLLAAGADASMLAGPLKNYSALNCDERSDIVQMIEDLGQLLEIVPSPVAAYETELMDLLWESKLEELRRAS